MPSGSRQTPGFLKNTNACVTVENDLKSPAKEPRYQAAAGQRFASPAGGSASRHSHLKKITPWRPTKANELNPIKQIRRALKTKKPTAAKRLVESTTMVKQRGHTKSYRTLRLDRSKGRLVENPTMGHVRGHTKSSRSLRLEGGGDDTKSPAFITAAVHFPRPLRPTGPGPTATHQESPLRHPCVLPSLVPPR